jgi:flagellar basal-body rod protein FlgB
MAIDPLFGIHADALAVQRKRMDVLASNIANADTPNFLARDVDFAKVLADAAKQGDSAAGQNALALTNARHLEGAPAADKQSADTVYRIPLQPSVDGNTVDAQVEQGAFADSALHYQASLSFINNHLRSLMTAITGQ